jgi:hypothetical protein
MPWTSPPDDPAPHLGMAPGSHLGPAAVTTAGLFIFGARSRGAVPVSPPPSARRARTRARNWTPPAVADVTQAHVLAFVTAYNFAKHLKALRWRTPFQAICEAWAKDPAPFKINPHHLIPTIHLVAWFPRGKAKGTLISCRACSTTLWGRWPRPRRSCTSYPVTEAEARDAAPTLRGRGGSLTLDRGAGLARDAGGWGGAIGVPEPALRVSPSLAGSPRQTGFSRTSWAGRVGVPSQAAPPVQQSPPRTLQGPAGRPLRQFGLGGVPGPPQLPHLRHGPVTLRL